MSKNILDSINEGITKDNKSTRATILMEKDGLVLMIYRLRDGHEYYTLPGGGVEGDESVEQAALRELKEETSIMGKIEQKVFDFTDSNRREHQILSCIYISGEPQLSIDSPENIKKSESNIHKPMWVDQKQIPNLTIWPDGTKQLLIKRFSL